MSNLEAYVAHLFDSDPVVRGLTMRILRAQKRLRGRVDEKAWLTYLRIEAMVNHRHAKILQKVFDNLVRRRKSRASR